MTAALRLLSTHGLPPTAISRFWHSRAVPAGSGPDFVNACALVRTPGSPYETLASLHEIEASLGRERHQRWEPRVVDLDLLGQGPVTLPDAATQARWVALPPSEQERSTPDQLILPHPRLLDRAFVLIPLRELVPDWVPAGAVISVSEAASRLTAAQRDGLAPFR